MVLICIFLIISNVDGLLAICMSSLGRYSVLPVFQLGCLVFDVKLYELFCGLGFWVFLKIFIIYLFGCGMWDFSSLTKD